MIDHLATCARPNSAARTRLLAATLLLGAVTLAPTACRPDSAPNRDWDRSADRAWSTRDQSIVVGGMRPDSFAVQQGGVVRDAALTLLLQASESSSPLLRAHAIEAIGAAPAEARLALQRALGDANRGVRFVATMSVAIMRLDDLAPFVEPLLRDESASVQAAAILALDRAGRRPDQSPLASMIRSEDAEVRGNTAMVIGELGNPSALPMLQASLGRGMRLSNPAAVRIIELQVAEAQVKLGDDAAIDPIRAALFAPPEQAELVALAAQISGRVGDRTSVAFLRQLVAADGLDRRPAEIRLAAAAALGAMQQSDGSLLAEVTAYVSDPDPARRAQAAVTIGKLRDRRGLEHVGRLLSDPDPLVQVAAAGAVLRLTD